MDLLKSWQKKYEGCDFFWQKILYSIFAGIVFVSLYTMVGKFYLGTPQFLPLTWIDQNTPFLLWTFWIYISDYLFLFVAGILCPTQESFQQFKKSFWIVVWVHIFIFFFFPTEILRPQITGDGISAMIGKYIHIVDGTVNCCPSLHVSLTLLGALVISKNHRRIAIPVFIWALAIIISTLTTKQHYWYDVIGGTLVALIVFFPVTMFQYNRDRNRLILEEKNAQ